MTTETQQKIARCPHCGHDEFVVNESEVKKIRLLGQEKYPYVKEEIISSEGRGYDVVSCLGCEQDLDPSDWFNSMEPDHL